MFAFGAAETICRLHEKNETFLLIETNHQQVFMVAIWKLTLRAVCMQNFIRIETPRSNWMQNQIGLSGFLGAETKKKESRSEFSLIH